MDKEIKKDKSSNPKIIIAKTLKGKGVSFLEDKDGWHGKALKDEDLSKALEQIGKVEKLRSQVSSIKYQVSNERNKTTALG